MAKKKEKKNDLDRKFVECVRKGAITILSSMIESCIKDEYLETIHAKFQMFKDYYYHCKDEFVYEKLTYAEYCNFLNYIEDVYIAGSYSIDNITPMLKSIKNKIVEAEKDKGSEWDFFVSVNRVGAVTDVATARDGVRGMFKDLSGIIMLCSIYILTYQVKLKNKVVQDLYDYEDIVKGKFSSINLLSNEEIEVLSACSKYNKNKNMYAIMQKVVTEYDVKSSNYAVGEIAKEYIDKTAPSVAFRIKGDMGEFPFDSFDESIINLEKLNSLPDNRKYVVPSAGVRFEFLDKSKNIDSIEMKESNGRVLFCVNLVKSNYLYMATGIGCDNKLSSDNIEQYKYNKDIFRMPFIISTNSLKVENINLVEICLDSKYITFTPIITNGEEEKQFAKILYSCLCCMYASYYNPKMFDKTFKMYTINRKEKRGYSREESFRIAHLRKLPKGYKMSNEAKELAKKHGFNYIPKGYTFVSASNVDKEPDTKKVIKIKNI